MARKDVEITIEDLNKVLDSLNDIPISIMSIVEKMVRRDLKRREASGKAGGRKPKGYDEMPMPRLGILKGEPEVPREDRIMFSPKQKAMYDKTGYGVTKPVEEFKEIFSELETDNIQSNGESVGGAEPEEEAEEHIVEEADFGA